MPRSLSAAFVVTAAFALSVATASAGGLEGHKIRFEVRTPGSDTACVSWYEATSKQGPAKDPTATKIDLVDAPWSISTNTGKKVRHWRVTAWASDDCASTEQPKGAVRCRIKVDGKVKVASKQTDAIVFCSI